MPGLPIGNLCDADALNSQINRDTIRCRVPRASSYDLKRMPLHHIPAASRYNGASSDLPVILADYQASARFTPPDDKPLTTYRDPAGHFAAQFVPGIYGSADSEHDLAAMVHDFMENGSYGSDIPDSSEGENCLPSCPRLLETLQAFKCNFNSTEKELLSIVSIFLPSIEDVDLFCFKSGAQCKGDCIRQMLVKHLRWLGYDAAVCSSKWSNSGKVPGGEYEYIDVFLKGENGPVERLIVDVDFQSQFEIARPTQSYTTALKFLPLIFVGSEEKLKQVLQVMAEAVKMSLKQNSMLLPPWRTLEYMTAKWMSPCERNAADSKGSILHADQASSQWRDHTRAKQCVEQLRHLKLCMAAELDNHIPKPPNLERNLVMYFNKTTAIEHRSCHILIRNKGMHVQ